MIKYSYFTVKTPVVKNRYVTVCVDCPEKNDPDQSHFVGVAFCSNNDSFKKDLGRSIAIRRLEIGKSFTKEKLITIIPDSKIKYNFNNVLRAALKEIAKQKNAPYWFRRAVAKDKIVWGLKA